MVTNNCSDAIHPIKRGGVGSGETKPKPTSLTTSAVTTNTRRQNVGDMKVNVLPIIGEANSLAARVIELGNKTKYNREIGRFLATRVETCKSILSTFRLDARYFNKQYKEYIDMLQRIRLYIIKADQSAAFSEMILQPSKSFFGTFKIAQTHSELADSLDRIVYDMVLESFTMQQHSNDNKHYNHSRAKPHHKIEEIKKLKETVHAFLLSSLLKCKFIQPPAKNLSGLPTSHNITSLLKPEETTTTTTTTTQNTQVVPCKRGLTLWKDSCQAYYFALFCEHLLNSTFYRTLLSSLHTDDLTLSPKNKKQLSNLVKKQESSNLVDSQNHQTLTVPHILSSEPSPHTSPLSSEPEGITEKRPNQTPILDRPTSTVSESTLFEQDSITDEKQISAESTPMAPEKTPTRRYSRKNFFKHLYRSRKSAASNSPSSVGENDQRPVSALSDVTISVTEYDVVVPDESIQSTQASNEDKRRTELAGDAPQKASEPVSRKKKWYQKLTRKPQNSKSSTTAAAKTDSTKKKILPLFGKTLGASKKEDKQKSKSLKMDNSDGKKKIPKKTEILRGYGEIMKVVNVDAFCII